MINNDTFFSILKKYDEKDHFSGTVLIGKNGKEIFSYSCGYENIAYNIKNSENTIFPTASATKIFTAVAIFHLINRGDLNLNSSVVEILGLKNSTISKEIKVENLLNHTSGIADYFDEYDENFIENIWGRVPNSSVKEIKDFLPYFIKKQSIFNPGDKFDYCNSNYILLGLIIEEITNMNYFDYLRESIFLKYGLNNTDFISLDSTKKFAEGYIPIYDKCKNIVDWRKNVFLIPANGSPDGGVYTSVKDFNNFFIKLRNGDILPNNLLDIIINPKFLDDVGNENADEQWRYNFGMWFNIKDNNIICYGVTGGDPGVSVKAFYYKESDMTVIILENRDNCSNDLSNEIRNTILSESN